MSEFIAFWPQPDSERCTVDVSAVAKVVSEGLNEPVGEPITCDRAWLLVSSPDAPGVQSLVEPELGWIAVKGALLQDSTSGGPCALHQLLRDFCEGRLEPNRYEGSFAVVAWNARLQEGLAFNDQTSVIHEYYVDVPGGCLVSTAALPLARSLGKPLCPGGVREFLLRGCVTGRTTMFADIQRLELGEHLRWTDGRLQSGTHWLPYQPVANHADVHEAASHVAGATADLVKRYAAAMGSVVVDLTGGYDSRLLASAAHFARILSAVTVNGSPEFVEDARLSLEVAKRAGWEMAHFIPDEQFRQPIDPAMRRELTYRTGGDMPFDAIYHHQFTRPLLAKRFDMHGIGVGGEFTRYHCWGQEFTGVGRRRPANLKNLLNYRYFTGRPFPRELVTGDWQQMCWDDLYAKLNVICDLGPGSLTTQQLDAVHLWKMMGHSSLYVSALHHWLPTSAPLMNRSFVEACIAVPWRMRLTSGLQRRIIYLLAPRAAKAPSAYGAPASPVMLTNAHRHAWQIVRRTRHILEKVARVYANRNYGPQRKQRPGLRFDTPEFREFFHPRKMRSRPLYGEKGIQTLVGQPESWPDHKNVIARMATVEQLCVELDWEPPVGFLD